MYETLLVHCEKSFAADVENNMAIGQFGAEDILKRCRKNSYDITSMDKITTCKKLFRLFRW